MTYHQNGQREGTSEVQKDLDNFEAAYPLIFRQREFFNILVSKSRLRQRNQRNKRNLMRESDTRDLVVVSKQVKLRRKDGIAQKLVFKTKGPYIFLGKAKPSSY